MKKLIIEIFLLIIGVPVFLLVFIIGVLYTLIKHIIKKDYSITKQLIPIIRNTNLVFDGLANSGGGELLNDAFKIKHTIIKYGKWYETISAVTGLLYLTHKDTKLRKFLDKVLGTNHCVEAITDKDKIYYLVTNITK